MASKNTPSKTDLMNIVKMVQKSRSYGAEIAALDEAHAKAEEALEDYDKRNKERSNLKKAVSQAWQRRRDAEDRYRREIGAAINECLVLIRTEGPTEQAVEKVKQLAAKYLPRE